jgi:hypothetical protein
MTQSPVTVPRGPMPLSGRIRRVPWKLALAVEILGTYVRVRWLLWRRKKLPAVVDALRSTRVQRRPQGVPPHLAAVRLGRAVTRTLPLLPTDSRCLMRSLVLTSVLARRGLPSRLIIGVQPDGGFDAHAWVEHEGKPVLPTTYDVYGRLLEV